MGGLTAGHCDIPQDSLLLGPPECSYHDSASPYRIGSHDKSHTAGTRLQIIDLPQLMRPRAVHGFGTSTSLMVSEQRAIGPYPMKNRSEGIASLSDIEAALADKVGSCLVCRALSDRRSIRLACFPRKDGALTVILTSNR